ncbi:hypothetical protein DMC30DRAFT_387497 [Rhodotorula diobovata]|uniref:Stress-response A/B barrel domain-containing protein n=1 Tax=Rhodotorula diobovata TaxID=5288 RepID=A0A5C5G4Y2_9BASI|nr:hypothetical protein DMC30DRAFT_387497 [Rhodotorula diobovata]
MPSIIHVVMLKFNDQLPPDFIEGTLRPEAHKMVGQIPGLKRVELGKPLELTKARSQGWQAMLYSEMESEDALKTYAAHDVHEQFKALFKPYVADILAYDMEI